MVFDAIQVGIQEQNVEENLFVFGRIKIQIIIGDQFIQQVDGIIVIAAETILQFIGISLIECVGKHFRGDCFPKDKPVNIEGDFDFVSKEQVGKILCGDHAECF